MPEGDRGKDLLASLAAALKTGTPGYGSGKPIDTTGLADLFPSDTHGKAATTILSSSLQDDIKALVADAVKAAVQDLAEELALTKSASMTLSRELQSAREQVATVLVKLEATEKRLTTSELVAEGLLKANRSMVKEMNALVTQSSEMTKTVRQNVEIAEAQAARDQEAARRKPVQASWLYSDSGERYEPVPDDAPAAEQPEWWQVAEALNEPLASTSRPQPALPVLSHYASSDSPPHEVDDIWGYVDTDPPESRVTMGNTTPVPGAAVYTSDDANAIQWE